MYQLNELEHRWGERFPVDLPVQVAVNSVSGIDARLKNLSLSGGLLNADFDIRIHTVIDIKLRMPPSAPPIKAYVIRQLNKDFGVEWYDFAPNAIKELLRSLAGQPLTRQARSGYGL